MKNRSVITSVLVAMTLLSIIQVPLAQEEEYVMRVIMYWEPPPGGHFNFFISGCSVSSSEIWGITAESLGHYFVLNDTYKPWLAEEWEVTADSFVVHLREGVTWSDGSAFTSNDVVSTFYTLFVQNHILWQYIDGASATDDTTVVFDIKEPSFLIQYYVLTQPIMPHSVYGTYSDAAEELKSSGSPIGELLADFTQFRPEEFIGTGPYLLETITESQQVYSKREDYWAEDFAKIYFDKVVVIRCTSDPQAAELELANEVDYDECGGFVMGQIEEAPKNLNCTFAIHPLFSGPAIYFNFEVPPLNLKEVRQAICYAINKTMAAQAGYPISTTDAKQPGYAREAKMFMSPEAYEGLADYSYDPEKAEELLTSVGFARGADGVWVSADGTRLEFELLTPAGYATGRVGTQAAAQLEEFGIKLNVRAVEPPTNFDRLQKGDFEILSEFWGGGLPYPYYGAALWTYDLMPSVTGYPGPGYPSTYEWEGQVFDVTEETPKLNLGFDLAAQEDRIDLLAQIYNEYLPLIQVGQKANPVFINYENIEWPPITLPDGSASPWTYTYEGNLAWLIVHGLVKPKGLEEEVPAGPDYTLYAAVGVVAVIVIAVAAIFLRRSKV